MQSSETASFYLKTRRTFSAARQYGWLLTVLIGVGGQFVPRLGLLVPPIMAALMVMSFFRGKYWCGNFCPHGSFFDGPLLSLSRNRRIPAFLRSPYLIAAVLLFFMFNMGRHLVSALETPGALPLYDRIGLVFSTTYLMVLLAGGLLALTVNARTWCRFCPMGTFQAILYRLGRALGVTAKTDRVVAATDPALCLSCAKCARVCPVQLSPYRSFSAENRFDDPSCIRCSTCVNNCPAGVLQLTSAARSAGLDELPGRGGKAQGDSLRRGGRGSE